MSTMELAVVAVDEVLTEKEFMSALKEFTQQHCDVFESSDENKLEYTPIFENYAKLVEQYVDKRLVEKGVDLEKFMADLPAYIDSADAHPRTGAVLELLSSFDSFVAFKDMMLEAKKSKASDEEDTKDSQQSFGADLSSVTFLKENVGRAHGHALYCTRALPAERCSRTAGAIAAPTTALLNPRPTRVRWPRARSSS